MTLIVIISLSVLIIFYSKLNIKSENSKIIEDEFSNSSYDILKPKFTINNKKNKITITANQGDFLNKNEILLKNDVLFISKRFKISSDEVLFNKNNQTASSKNRSVFLSKGTKIISRGFDIIEDGNVIHFNGKTIITLSK